MVDAAFTQMVAGVRASPFSAVIKGDLERLVCLHRIGVDSIPLGEVPALSPFVGVAIRRTYDFRNSIGVCIECGEKNKAIICEPCLAPRVDRLAALGICGHALISDTMCVGELRGKYCQRHWADKRD